MAVEAPKIKVVVIGTSAGGVEALSALLVDLEVGFRRPIVIVIHQPADATNIAVELFSGLTKLAVTEAEDKCVIEAGKVYFAPAGYHLLLEKSGTFSLTVEPLVNYSRPSIDVMFESAADAFGPNVTGILLTGANHDGAIGLQKIQAFGGATLIQDPTSARYPQMPQAALNLMAPDFVLPLQGLRDFLVRLK